MKLGASPFRKFKVCRGAVISVFILIGSLLGQDKQQTFETALDSLFLEYYQARQFNGIACIWQQDSLLYQQALGFTDLGKSSLFSFNDSMLIPSLTDQVSGYLILNLLENSTVSVKDSLGLLFPDFTGHPWEGVTIEALLTSAIPTGADQDTLWDQPTLSELRDLTQLSAELPPITIGSYLTRESYGLVRGLRLALLRQLSGHQFKSLLDAYGIQVENSGFVNTDANSDTSLQVRGHEQKVYTWEYADTPCQDDFAALWMTPGNLFQFYSKLDNYPANSSVFWNSVWELADSSGLSAKADFTLAGWNFSRRINKQSGDALSLIYAIDTRSGFTSAVLHIPQYQLWIVLLDNIATRAKIMFRLVYEVGVLLDKYGAQYQAPPPTLHDRWIKFVSFAKEKKELLKIENMIYPALAVVVVIFGIILRQSWIYWGEKRHARTVLFVLLAFVLLAMLLAAIRILIK